MAEGMRAPQLPKMERECITGT